MIDQLLFPQQSIYKKGVRSRQEFSNKSTGLGPYIMFFFFVSLTTQRIKFNTSLKKEKQNQSNQKKYKPKKQKKGEKPGVDLLCFLFGCLLLLGSFLVILPVSLFFCESVFGSAFVVFWLVGLTILKNMKVNGKDYPIYYGK